MNDSRTSPNGTEALERKPRNGKPFRIKGADGQTIEVASGEYYFNTKARLRRLMLNSLSPEARRVYASLEMGTMGFRQELAVKPGKRRPVPLTPTDIVEQTGLTKQHVRRALVELEIEGLAERRADDGGALRNGHILIYSWAVPRAADPQKGSQRAATFPDWFPPEWEPLKPLIKRLKLSIVPDKEAALGYLKELTEAARDYERAEKVAIERLKGISARPPSNKEERKERNPERKASSSSVRSVVGEGAPPAQPATTTTTIHPKLSSEEGRKMIGAALASYGRVEPAFIDKLWAEVRARAPQAHAADVAQVIHDKAPLRRSGGLQFFLTAVPPCFPLVLPTTAPAAGPRTAASFRPAGEDAGAWGTELTREELERTLAGEMNAQLREHLQARLKELEQEGK